MIDTWQLSKNVKEALGAKRFATAVGRTLQTVYSWSRDPMDPDADHSTNLWDWMEAVIDALAARPGGRPVIIQIRLWFMAITDRALSAHRPQAITRDELAMHTSETMREFSEMLRECCPDDFDSERLLKEGSEAIDAIKRLMAGVREGIAEDERRHNDAVRLLNQRRPA